jgi:hypothetical protein
MGPLGRSDPDRAVGRPYQQLTYKNKRRTFYVPSQELVLLLLDGGGAFMRTGKGSTIGMMSGEKNQTYPGGGDEISLHDRGILLGSSYLAACPL